MSEADLLKKSPEAVAEQIVSAHGEESSWLDAFAEELAKRRAGQDLSRILSTWGLSASAAARIFGVSRQAFSKWMKRGVPEARLETISMLSAATDLLTRYLRHDRIPAVVRRPAAALGGASLLEMVKKGQSREVLAACRSMFDFGRAHG
jgi:predicted transcriptional regulator